MGSYEPLWTRSWAGVAQKAFGKDADSKHTVSAWPSNDGPLPSVSSSQLRLRKISAVLVALTLTAGVGLSTLRYKFLARGSPGDVSLFAAVARAPPGLISRFEYLGAGRCTNQTGMAYRGSELRVTSQECATRCRAAGAGCTGYQTDGRASCELLTGSFLPCNSDGNSSEGHRCFWHHIFKNNTSGLYVGPQPRIPKIIWSFWSFPNQTGEDLQDPSISVRVFLKMCYTNWQVLNPHYEVRLLDWVSVWRWLERADLPKYFEQLEIQHQSDVIRLALLHKHGGVWLDATSIMNKPLDSFFGPDPAVRTFFVQPPAVLPMRHEKRVNSSYHIENWFLAGPPRDPFLSQTLACVSEMYSRGAERLFNATGLFSLRQLQELRALDIVGFRGANSIGYLSTDACMFKVLDEDVAMSRWWNSPRVRLLSPDQGMEGFIALATQDIFSLRARMFEKVDDQLLSMFLGFPNGILKMTGGMRKICVEATPPAVIRCTNSTVRRLFTLLGVNYAKLPNGELCRSTFVSATGHKTPTLSDA